MIPILNRQESGTGQKQKAFILAARSLLKPTEVNLHHVPNWLRRQILATVGASPYGTSGWAVLDHAKDKASAHDAFDHAGSTTLRNGTPAYVSEPHDGDDRTLSAAKRFAELVQLRFWVCANSWWFPGQTVRFVFTLREAK